MPASACARAVSPQFYRPRQPKTTTLYQIVSGHGTRLEVSWDDRFADRFGPLRPVVPKTLEAYLRCGVLEFEGPRDRRSDQGRHDRIRGES